MEQSSRSSRTQQPSRGIRSVIGIDDRKKAVLGMLLLCFSTYLCMACLSYLVTWKGDQSIEGLGLLNTDGPDASNWCGRIGAHLASQCMYHGFGLGALMLPLLGFVIGMRGLKVKIMPVGRAIRMALAGMIIASLLLSYLFGEAGGYLGNGLGGGHGLYMTDWLRTVIGSMGTGVLIFALCFTFLTFTFKHFLTWCRKMGRRLNDMHLPQPHFRSRQQDSQEPETGIDEPDVPDGRTEAGTGMQEGAQAGRMIICQPSVPVGTLEFGSSDPEEKPSFEPDRDAGTISDDEPVKLTIAERIQEETATPAEERNRMDPTDPYDPTLDLVNYRFPQIDLLADYAAGDAVSQDELYFNKNKIVETLAYYKIKIVEISVTPGPTVTLYEIVPSPETRIARIKNLENDIAMRLKALGVRIIAPMPGKGTIGIEVPNKKPEIVSMKSLIASRRFQESNADIAIAIGKTISNETFVFDLAKMPHLLVAGSTGQGKSVGLNAIITSILYKKHPAELKFVLVDPKTVEFSPYDKIERHFLAKLPDAEEAIITDTQKVVYTIKSLCIEMDTRYNLLKDAGVRNIKEYNNKFRSRLLNPEEGHRFLPYIVVIIDEFSDLIMTAGKEIEMPIARLAQKARAAGMHLIVATQRPTTNIITGTIKANFPARIAFKVTSQIDSRTILDSAGAEQLIGRGDMLFTAGGETIRIQCGFIDIPEIEDITSFIGNQQGYPGAFLLPEYENEDGEAVSRDKETDPSRRDPLFEDAARLLVVHQRGSTSLIQRKFRIGYSRAGCIMDQLEAAGIVGPFEGSKSRKVLFSDEGQLDQYLTSLQA